MTNQKLLFVAIASLTATLTAIPSAQSSPPSKRYLVEFVDGKTNNGKAALKSVGGVIKLDLGKHNAVAAEIPDAKLSTLKSNPNVKSVEKTNCGIRSRWCARCQAVRTAASRPTANRGANRALRRLDGAGRGIQRRRQQRRQGVRDRLRLRSWP